MDGKLISVDGRPALRFERRLRHAPERVWRALTDETAEWFVVPVDWEQIDVVRWDPPRSLVWNWEAERYSYELTPEGDGCVLEFVHVFTTAYGPGSQHAAGWETYLDRLDALLAGGHLSEEDAHAPIGHLTEAYAVAFDEDPRPARKMVAGMAFRRARLEDGPTIVIERSYRQPVERVWRALTDAGELANWFPETMDVVDAEDGVRLVAEWHGDTLRFELSPEGAGCHLRFSHRFADRETAARSAAGWDRCFAALDALLAGAPMTRAESLELWTEVHEAYAEAYGVSPDLGREAAREHGLA